MSDAASLTTFLITDIEGSSLKWLNHREAMQGALTTHDAILREDITASGGEVFKTAGDAFYAAFAMPAAAVKAAARAQQDLSAADWSSIGGLKVRMAIHTGTAQSRAGDYFGPALNRVARLLALAHGGQILTTDSVARLVMAEREAHSAVLLGRQALDDPAQPVEVYQVKGPGLVAEFPPLRMRDTNRTNLPQQPTVLVGREHELQTLAHHVANSRLTSLTGTGGVGKTRLAIASAGEHSAMFPDGIWLVEFAPLSDPGLLPGAVATAVGLQLAPNVPPLQALANQMQLMDTLLIFDNCEHVIEAVAEMAEQLLNVTRRVRIIATTQEPLGVAGEQVMRLPSLSLPPETATTAEQVLQASAVQLFVMLAKNADARFVLDDRAAPTVNLICRRLDGVPLAIAMAAARAPTLGVEKLAQLLDQRFRVLTGGKRTALPRQQTLRATLDWSYGLLSSRDKAVFRRLSVFAGGFTLEAASAVTSDDAIDEFDVIEEVTSLVAKSLVTADIGGDTARYRLLETARLYALEKLAEAGESEDLARRHAMYFHKLFRGCRWAMARMTEPEFLDLYYAELGNLRMAANWCFASGGDSDAGVELVGTASWVVANYIDQNEARALREQALARLHPDTPALSKASLWFASGIGDMQSDPASAMQSLLRAADIFRSLGHTEGLFMALVILANGAFVAGNIEVARPWMDELATLREHEKFKRYAGFYERTMGAYWHAMGDYDKAHAKFSRSAALFRETGWESPARMSDFITLYSRRMFGDQDRALAAARDLLSGMRQARAPRKVELEAGLYLLLAILIERGELSEATALLPEMLSLFREGGYIATEQLALLAAKKGDLKAAARLLGYSTVARERRMGFTFRIEDRSSEATMVLLKAQISDAEIQALLAEGAALGNDDILRIIAAL